MEKEEKRCGIVEIERQDKKRGRRAGGCKNEGDETGDLKRRFS